MHQSLSMDSRIANGNFNFGVFIRLLKTTEVKWGESIARATATRDLWHELFCSMTLEFSDVRLKQK